MKDEKDPYVSLWRPYFGIRIDYVEQLERSRKSRKKRPTRTRKKCSHKDNAPKNDETKPRIASVLKEFAGFGSQRLLSGRRPQKSTHRKNSWIK